MTNQEQISHLNNRVMVHIAPSAIHGVGVFAMRHISKGTKLHLDMYPQVYPLPYSQFSKLLPRVREYLLERWPQVANGSHFMFPDCRFQSFMNHSDDPNYDDFDDIAIRDIEAGEEITEDYRSIPNYQKIYPWLQ